MNVQFKVVAKSETEMSGVATYTITLQVVSDSQTGEFQVVTTNSDEANALLVGALYNAVISPA